MGFLGRGRAAVNNVAAALTTNPLESEARLASKVQLDWLQSMVTPAQLSLLQYNVPASVTLAQCILESAWGTSQLARRCNNYFGIKALADIPYIEFTTREVVTGRSVMELARFARYPSAIEGFAAHARLLSEAAIYAPAMRQADDPYAFAVALRCCGYSTSPTYSLKISELMHEFNLEQYDDICQTVPAALPKEEVA